MIRSCNLSLAVAFIGAFTLSAAAEQPANPPATDATDGRARAAAGFTHDRASGRRSSRKARAGRAATDCGGGR